MILVDETTKQVDPIIGFQKKLYPYQLSTINTMEILEKGINSVNVNDNNIEIINDFGILSNKVGSGKTLVVLGLCKRNFNIIKHDTVYTTKKITNITNDSRKSINGNFIIEKYEYKYDIFTNTSLIVSPSSIVKQWENEIKLTDLKYYTIKNTVNLNNLNNLSSFDVILCSNTFYNKLITIYNDITWNRVIFDEADSIKQTNKVVKYRFIWLITATFLNLKNINNNNFLNKFSLKSSEKLEYVKIECKEEYINSYINNNINKFYIDCLTPVYINILSRYISKEVQDLLNAGDLQTAISRLGGSVENDKDLIEVFKTKINNEISDLENELEFVNRLTTLSTNNKSLRIKNINEKIKSANTKFSSISEKIDEIKKENCSICLDTYINPVMMNCCNNIFCFECIKNSINVNPKCVFCRSPVNFKNMIAVVSDKIEKVKEKRKEKLLTKEEQCIKIINNNPDGKFLVFSNYSFLQIKKTLDNKYKKYKELKGGSDIVNRVIKNYKEKNLNILLLNIDYKGSGINLENTTDIIIFHKVNPSLETQIIGRAMRIGRNKNLPLNIHYLKHENEYI